MRCFITGATGFIGSGVAEELVAKNHEVVGLTHSPGKTDQLEENGIHPVLGDIREPEKWIASVRGADTIVHTATIPVPNRPGKQYIRKLSDAQRTVVSHLIDVSSGCKAFIYTSGMTVYGYGKQTKNEDSELDPVELAKPYVAGERLVKKAIKERNLPAVILRPGAVYGDGGIFAKHWTTPLSTGKFAPYPGNGRQVKSFISHDDCVQAYVRCIENPMPGEVFNVVDDEPVDFKTIIRFLAAEMNAPKPFGIPRLLFRILGGIILAEMLLTDMKISNAKIKKKLSYSLKYPTYREGIAALAQKCRNRDEIKETIT